MNRKTIGMVLLIVGVIFALVSLLADSIGVGSYPGINGAQILGMVVGIVVAIVGAWLSIGKAVVK